ncbi:hypothetical protein FC89_GL002382 [Liquorilactobacillus ghanensis DSM 18630]|uniref:Uncharacterized protein n=2 Tax=Liquorilactobacillus ghanensis TaxID=399370 RepID=A0A0R1VQM4_9LACO|nr:BglG family transcription antiterminator [Liquorilactobacillus ghanensis]KRM03980.1 hypothetical protein FC89_GL002382 [Liquorilactobacillus ghanensis DSM 18630]
MDDLNSRQLKLIKYLMKIKNTTAAKLAFYLNVSSKTIYQDLDNVADFLGKHQVKVTRKPGTGIELHGNLKKLSIFLLTDRKRINVPNNDSQRIVYILAKLLETNQYLTISSLSEQLFISSRIIEKNLNQIAKYLNSFSVKLDRKSSQGIKIIANEEQRRKLIFRLLNNFWGEQWSVNHKNKIVYHNLAANSLLDNQIVLRVLKIVDQFETVSQVSLNDYEFQSLTIHLAIAIQRIKSGKMIAELPIQNLKKQQLSQAQLLASMIERDFKIELPSAEIKYLQLHLIAATSGGITFENISPNDEAYVELQLLLKKFGYDANLLRGLAVHLKSASKRLHFNASIANPFTATIKQNYPAAFDQGLQIARFYEKKENISLNDDEVAYLALHLQAYLERNHQDDDRLKVVIVCSTGLGSAQLLAARIRSEFPEIKILGVYSLNELQTSITEETDLIISTIEIRNSIVPTVTVSPLLQATDISFINQTVKKIKQNKKNTFNPAKILNPHLVWCQQSFTDWQATLRWITKQLVIQKIAKEGVTESALNRENLSFTSFGNYATPHASPELIIKPSIAVCTLNPSIKWGNQEISVVFFLAITKDFTPKEIELIFDKLCGILDEKKLLKKLSTFNDTAELFQYLKRLMNK